MVRNQNSLIGKTRIYIFIIILSCALLSGCTARIAAQESSATTQETASTLTTSLTQTEDSEVTSMSDKNSTTSSTRDNRVNEVEIGDSGPTIKQPVITNEMKTIADKNPIQTLSEFFLVDIPKNLKVVKYNHEVDSYYCNGKKALCIHYFEAKLTISLKEWNQIEKDLSIEHKMTKYTDEINCINQNTGLNYSKDSVVSFYRCPIYKTLEYYTNDYGIKAMFSYLFLTKDGDEYSLNLVSF